MMRNVKQAFVTWFLLLAVVMIPVAQAASIKQRVGDTALEELLGWVMSLPGLSKLEQQLENNQIQWVSQNQKSSDSLAFEFETESDAKLKPVFKLNSSSWMPVNGTMLLNKNRLYKVGFVRDGKVIGERSLFYSQKLSQISEPATLLKTQKNKSQLHIKTYPVDARIRILNIKPVYTEGMMLKPGKYRIE